MPQDEDIYTIQQRSMKNEDNIRALDISLNALADKTQQDIDNLDNAIDDDNRQRDRNISEISHNLALLKLFVIEKLSNHPNDYVDYINHLASQPINNSDNDNSSVMSDDDLRERFRRLTAPSSYASSVMSDTASDISTPAASTYASSVASDDSFTGGRRKKRKRTRKKKRRKSKKKSRRKYK
jgi:hypothetical protein